MKEKEFIPITRPLFGKEEIKEVGRVIKSGWVTQGPEVEAFENDFNDYVGSKYTVAVSSCTAALHLALKAVGVRENNEVITVSHSYIATANSITYCSAIPVFVDIEPETYNIDPNLIEEAISNKTKAILCVHQMGMPCDLNAILKIAKQYSLAVIEDAACAAGSEIKLKNKWEKIGKPHGDIACFSFHPRKLITTGDGGMITTNSKSISEKLRLWRQHGMSISDKKRHSSKTIVFEDHLELGYNYRLTDIQAAVGRVQLKKLSEIITRRRKLAKNYFDLFSNSNSIILPHEPIWAKTNWQSFCIRLPKTVKQKTIMELLLDNGIATRRGVMCTHLEPAYINVSWHTRGKKDRGESLFNSVDARNNTILLPLFPQMKKHIQQNVFETISRIIEG